MEKVLNVNQYQSKSFYEAIWLFRLSESWVLGDKKYFHFKFFIQNYFLQIFITICWLECRGVLGSP